MRGWSWVLMGLLGCGKTGGVVAGGTVTEVGGDVAPIEDPTPGADLILREAGGVSDAPERLARPVVSELGADAVRGLLARLPALPAAAEEPWRLREASSPPPVAGEAVSMAFPELASPPPAPALTGPPRVVRLTPEGDVGVAPHVAVTFDRPMVALTTADAAASTLPVVLTPRPPGAWRWLGTKTAIFEPAVRLPMATRFTVEVPAGTPAMDGTTFPQAFRGELVTPPARLVGQSPTGDAVGLSPVLTLRFDQAVDPEQVRAHAELRVGGRSWPLRLAGTAGRRAADPSAPDDHPEREVLLMPGEPLPPATRASVRLPAGLPSAEGPLPTTEPQGWEFTTYGPLQIADAGCGGPCYPGEPLRVELSNPVDAATLRAEVRPELPGAVVNVWGGTVVVQGPTKPSTTYTVTLADGLRDVFGQALQGRRSAEITYGKAEPPWPWIGVLGPAPQIVDPSAAPRASFLVQGLDRVRVRVSRVSADDWAAWVAEPYFRGRAGAPLPGRVVTDEARDVPDTGGDARLLEVALVEALGDAPGHVVVEVSGAGRGRDVGQRVWVSATGLGLTTLSDADDVYAWVTDLRTGQPVVGASVTLGKAKATTGPDGLATLPVPPRGDGQPPLVARRGEDTALLSAQGGARGGWAWGPETPGAQAAWLMFDDRHLYRPGERVAVKGWLRTVDMTKGGDLLPANARSGQVLRWTATDAGGAELAQGQVTLDGFGGFDLGFELPATPHLGAGSLTLQGPDGVHGYHGFQVAEFRRPEMEVAARVTSLGPHLRGVPLRAEVSATYFAGGAVPGAEVSWSATVRSASWSPPGWDGWRFGAWEPWWCWWGRGEEVLTSVSLGGRTDAAGLSAVEAELRRVMPERPVTVTLDATVQDVNRQAWTASASALVHPSAVYVGARPASNHVEAGQPVVVEVVRVGVDGEPFPGPVDVALVRRVWKQREGGDWGEVDDEVLRCEARPSSGPATCTFKPTLQGAWEVRARVTDADARGNTTTFPVWVGAEQRPSVDTVVSEDLRIVPDKDLHAPGDVAELAVQLPFHPAELLISTQRAGVLSTERRLAEGGSVVVRVPVGEEHLPDLTVRVDAVGVGGGGRPALAAGELTLRVAPAPRTLQVVVAPAERALEPGGATDVVVTVRDARGEPVAGATVALVAVDEAVLALTGYELPDPLGVLYPARGGGVWTRENRTDVVLRGAEAPAASPGEVAEGAALRKDARGMGGMADMMMSDAMPAPMAAASMMEGDAAAEPSGPAIAVRSDFSALALWAPALTTDARGRVVQRLKLPDNLTRYRVSAVALDTGRAAGVAEVDVTARLPLMLRPSLPRFLSVGDEAELPFVLHNQTSAALVVDLAARSDLLTLQGGRPAGRRVTVPANDRVEVRLPASARTAGRAIVQAAASSGRYADAASVSLPVNTPATTEAFATYGSLDGPKGTLAVRERVDLPDDVWPEHGGLEIETSTTALQQLTDAVIYLVDYPYGCVEQLASRVLAVAALHDVLAAFDAEGLPDQGALREMVQADLAELARRQSPQGWWGWWTRSEREASPVTTLHAAHAMVRARAAGFEVDERALREALEQVQRIDALIPQRWGPEARRALQAQAVAVLHAAGRPDARLAREVATSAGVDALSVEAIGWVLPTLRDAGDDPLPFIAALHRRVTESAASARFVTSYGEVDDAMILASSRRSDAVALDALLQVAPSDPLLPKVVAGLLDGRRQGHWGSTQEDAWVLLSLQRAFRVLEGVTPDLVARAWWGDAPVGAHRYQGRTTERAGVTVPMAALLAGGPADVTLSREGAGRLYWRMGLRYAPRSLWLDAADRGFEVVRTYEPVDDPADVTQDADGTWRFRAGARVRVRLRMVAPDRRYHVALVDPLPAGVEIIDPGLKGAQPDAADEPEVWRWWWGAWHEHVNLRDDRAEAFTSTLWPGVHAWDYVVRATTPGRFVVAPAKAEEMYHPETFGRSSSAHVVVE